jgi:leader peptidase (prepilin peptidase)/N-methyltransferase
LSFILLRGKCRFCKEKISWRYPLVELLTALISLVLFMRYGLTYDFLVYMVLAWALIIATFVDIAHRIIPDEVSIGGLILGFILLSVKGVDFNPLRFNFRFSLESLLGIIIGAGVIFLTGKLFDLVYFKMLKKPPIDGESESMGGGDVKLLGMIGAFVGWKLALLTFFIAPFLGVVIGVINLLVKKEHTIPYGPFLSFAALIALFFGSQITKIFFPLC